MTSSRGSVSSQDDSFSDVNLKEKIYGSIVFLIAIVAYIPIWLGSAQNSGNEKHEKEIVFYIPDVGEKTNPKTNNGNTNSCFIGSEIQNQGSSETAKYTPYELTLRFLCDKLKKELNDKLKDRGYEVRVENTTGSLDSLLKMDGLNRHAEKNENENNKKERYGLALAQSDAIYHYVNGKHPVIERAKSATNIRSIAVLFPEWLMIHGCSGETKLELSDIKKICAGEVGSGSQITSLNVLNSLSVKPDSIYQCGTKTKPCDDGSGHHFKVVSPVKTESTDDLLTPLSLDSGMISIIRSSFTDLYSEETIDADSGSDKFPLEFKRVVGNGHFTTLSVQALLVTTKGMPDEVVKIIKENLLPDILKKPDKLPNSESDYFEFIRNIFEKNIDDVNGFLKFNVNAYNGKNSDAQSKICSSDVFIKDGERGFPSLEEIVSCIDYNDLDKSKVINDEWGKASFKYTVVPHKIVQAESLGPWTKTANEYFKLSSLYFLFIVAMTFWIVVSTSKGGVFSYFYSDKEKYHKALHFFCEKISTVLIVSAIIGVGLGMYLNDLPWALTFFSLLFFIMLYKRKDLESFSMLLRDVLLVVFFLMIIGVLVELVSWFLSFLVSYYYYIKYFLIFSIFIFFMVRWVDIFCENNSNEILNNLNKKIDMFAFGFAMPWIRFGRKFSDYISWSKLLLFFVGLVLVVVTLWVSEFQFTESRGYGERLKDIPDTAMWVFRDISGIGNPYSIQSSQGVLILLILKFLLAFSTIRLLLSPDEIVEKIRVFLLGSNKEYLIVGKYTDVGGEVFKSLTDSYKRKVERVDYPLMKGSDGKVITSNGVVVDSYLENIKKIVLLSDPTIASRLGYRCVDMFTAKQLKLIKELDSFSNIKDFIVEVDKPYMQPLFSDVSDKRTVKVVSKSFSFDLICNSIKNPHIIKTLQRLLFTFDDGVCIDYHKVENLSTENRNQTLSAYLDERSLYDSSNGLLLGIYKEQTEDLELITRGADSFNVDRDDVIFYINRVSNSQSNDNIERYSNFLETPSQISLMGPGYICDKFKNENDEYAYGRSNGSEILIIFSDEKTAKDNYCESVDHHTLVLFERELNLHSGSENLKRIIVEVRSVDMLNAFESLCEGVSSINCSFICPSFLTKELLVKSLEKPAVIDLYRYLLKNNDVNFSYEDVPEDFLGKEVKNFVDEDNSRVVLGALMRTEEVEENKYEEVILVQGYDNGSKTFTEHDKLIVLKKHNTH